MEKQVRNVLNLTEQKWLEKSHPTRMYGKLAAKYCNEQLPVQVCKSAAGYYIGTLNNDGTPCSRESNEYYRKEHDADEALRDGTWTQKEHP